MKVKLFELGPDFMVRLDKEWISTIKEFKRILQRDKGSKGDIEGKRKAQAQREFTFIYHLCDYESKFWNFSQDDWLYEAARNAELGEDFNYTKDEDIVAAVKRYRELQESPALKLLVEAKEGLHTAHKVIRKIRVSLETKLEAVDFDELEIEEVGRGENKKQRVNDPVTKLTNNLKALMELTNQVSPALKTIKELEEEVRKELGEKQNLRGGKVKGFTEDGISKLLPKINEGEEESTGRPGIFADV